MLAALRADRFKLFKEPELIALDIPYELRRSTQDASLIAREQRPFDPKHSPIMTPAASYYLDTLEVARRESLYSQNFRIKHFESVKAHILAENARGPLDPPAKPAEKDLWFWHGEAIERWRVTCQANWDKLSDTERLWFDNKPEVSRWAWEFPAIAPPPQCFYPTEETPERERQFHLLEWVLRDCGELV